MNREERINVLRLKMTHLFLRFSSSLITGEAPIVSQLVARRHGELAAGTASSSRKRDEEDPYLPSLAAGYERMSTINKYV